MSYEPTEWKKGDVVTAAKLNKLETGVAGAGGALVVEMNQETAALNKTAGEILAALRNGLVYLPTEYNGMISVYIIYGTTTSGGGDHAGEIAIQIYNLFDDSRIAAYAATENDYPIVDFEG